MTGLPDDPEAEEYPDVIVPASFNFPHSAKLLSLSFIPFAAWFSEAAIGGVLRYLQLALVGLLSFFGSLNAAVPYLLDLFRIPHDTFQLFLATGVVNSRVGSAVARKSWYQKRLPMPARIASFTRRKENSPTCASAIPVRIALRSG